MVIKSIPNDIRVFRLEKGQAVEAYLKYKAVKKKIEWLGLYNGKKFDDKTEPTQADLED